MLDVAAARPERGRRARDSVITTTAVADAIAGSILVAAAIVASQAALRMVVAVVAIGLLAARGALGARFAGSEGAVAWAALSAVLLLVMAPGLVDADDLPVLSALAGLAVVPLIATVLPATFSPGFAVGRREDLTSTLLLCAVTGGAGALGAMGLAELVDVDDPRLGELAPYVAAGAALLGLAEVLAHHRVGARFAETAMGLTLLPVGVEALVLLDPGGAAVDDAVTAMVTASAAAAIGLLVATVAASPRPLTIPVEETRDGPRLVGWTLAGLVLLAVAVRILSWRDVWLDEASLARAASADSVPHLLDTAKALDAHPPLLDAVLWASRQLFGSGELALRWPAIVAGVLLVPAVYLAATRLYDRRVGLVAAIITALGPALVWLSTTARPGVVTALLATLALFTLLRAVEDDRLVDWLLFGVTGAALVWVHQLGFVHVLVLQAAVAAKVWRDRRRGLALPANLVPGWLTSAVLSGGAFVALLVYRGGIGPPRLLPPLEYATAGAPAAGRSVFGLVGTGVVGVLGFHPEDVTSRLLALWPLGILVVFVLAVRSWTSRSVLLAALAAAPFVVLLAAQIAGAPRDPPFALEWTATAVPMLAIGLARALTLWGRWSTVRVGAAALAAVLAVAVLDQAVRIEPVGRFAVAPAAEQVGDQAEAGDVVLYAPDLLGDLVREEAPDVRAVPVEDADQVDLADAPQVFVVGAFGYMQDGSGSSDSSSSSDSPGDATLALVDQLSSERSLADESEHGDTKVWRFR